MVLCLVSGCAASGREYYVSPRGSDANPGTAAGPWKSIERVNRAALRPGDRVLFEGGNTFAGTLMLDARDSGTKGTPVTLSSYGNGRATINGGNASGLIAKGCSYLRVTNLNFVGSGGREGNTESGLWLRDATDIEVDQVEVSGFRGTGLLLAGIHHARVTHVYAHDNGACGMGAGQGDPGAEWSDDLYFGHCVAENNPGDPSNLDNHSGNGIVVGYVKGCLIEYCEAFNNGWDMPRKGNGPVGIWAWNADRVVIQFCISHDNKSPGDDGGGFDFDGGVTNSILQYNYSYRNQGPGYFLCQYPTAPEWRNNIVRYNISVNDGLKNNIRCGFEVYGGDERMSDAEVYNNTVYNQAGGAVGFGGLPAPRVRFRNNIFVGTGELIRGDASPSRFEGNCYWSLPAGRQAGVGGEYAADPLDRRPPSSFSGEHEVFADWVAATGQERAGELTLGRYADPLLVDPLLVGLRDPEKLGTLMGYRLREDSPCIGAGITIEDNGGRDFLGAEAPCHGKPSMGACQSAFAEPTADTLP